MNDAPAPLIRAFIHRLVGKTVDDAQPLISAQLVESISAIQIVLFIEQKFGIEIPDSELVLTNFDSISAILSYVESKKGVSS